MLECSLDLENLSMKFRVSFLASLAAFALLTGCNAGVETSMQAPTAENAPAVTPAPAAASNPGAPEPGGNDKPAPVAEAPRGAQGQGGLIAIENRAGGALLISAGACFY